VIIYNHEVIPQLHTPTPPVQDRLAGIFFWILKVPEYRVYTIGPESHFGFAEMVCRDDGEAVVKAKRIASGCDVEVWCGDRFVLRLLHKPELNRTT
jgi:hypothetical protein